jgi:hypothetical protein
MGPTSSPRSGARSTFELIHAATTQAPGLPPSGIQRVGRLDAGREALSTKEPVGAALPVIG